MRNNRGVTLIELLIYIGLSGIVILAAYSLTNVSQNIFSTASIYTNLNDSRSQILDNLKNDTSFNNTLAAPANAAVFACINNHLNCAGGGGPFTLYDTVGNVVSAAAQPGTSQGLNRNGSPCTTFNANSGNDGCPFRYVVSWTPGCPPTGACVNPTIELSAQFQVKPANSKTVQDVNPIAYSITFVKSNKTATASDACTSIGGRFVNGICNMPYDSKQCVKPNQFLVGFNTDGTLKCRGMNRITCPKGQVLLGVNSGGFPVCGPGCTNLSPAAQMPQLWR